MSKKRVLLTGLASSVVDFSKWPELSPEKLQGASVQVERDLNEAGYISRTYLIDSLETAELRFETELKDFSYVPDSL